MTCGGIELLKLLFISTEDRADPWRKALREELPDLEFRLWPDEVGAREEIDYALAWKPPAGELRKYPNLKAILSLGAGIDHLAADPELPISVPVSRLVDRSLTAGMTEYVLYWVIHYHRNMGRYAKMMSEGIWEHIPQHDPRLRRVGVLGLGQLGGDAATKLTLLNYDVAGWSKSKKEMPGVQSFFGMDMLPDFLARSDILVCLLPITSMTKGIINSKNLAMLPKGAVLINCARGAHVIDKDLIKALNSGQLSGATLDVFHAEPLPHDHPYWVHPKIKLTPHMASLTVPQSAAAYIAENIRRVERGIPPLNTVNVQAGY